MEDLRLFTLPCGLGDFEPFNTLADLGSCNIIPLYLFKKLNIGLLEETDHIFGLADGTKSYPVGIVKDVKVRIESCKTSCRIIKRKLKTHDLLRPWDLCNNHYMNQLVCPLCEVQPDSHDHLFFGCQFSSWVWDNLKPLLCIPNVPSALDDIVAFLIPVAKMKSIRSVVCKLVFSAACYFLWQERNYRIFKKKKRSKDKILELIKSNVRLKLLRCPDGAHDTQYCMEDPKQAFVEYASLCTDEAGVKNLKLSTSPILSAHSYLTIDPQCSSHPFTSIYVIKAHSKEANISQTSLLRPGMEIKTQQLEEPKPTLEDEFQDLHLNLLVLEVLAHALIYNDILDKYVESLELGKSKSAFVQGEIPAKMEDPKLFTLPCRLGDSEPFDTLADLGSCVNIIPLYHFKKLKHRTIERD
ncbi:hypothetical protein Tco_1203902 [Tanacetum coccineum]